MPGSGEDEDVEEEEYLVHVEFDGLLDSNILNRPNVFFKLIGVDTDKPVMQIEEQVFTGEYRDVVGTALFFEEDPAPKVDDPVFGKNHDTQLRYVCKTRKSLLMSRVFLKAKGKDDDMETMDDKPSDEDNGCENASSDQDQMCGVDRLQNVSDKPVQESCDEDFQYSTGTLSSKQSEGPSRECSSELSQGSSVESSIEPLEGTCENQVKSESEGSRDEPKLLDISRSAPNPVDMVSSFEPIPGPSWAPDIPAFQLGVMQGQSYEKSADHVSRLIAEQMTIASDINLQNALIDSGETSD
ncbi:general transcription factor 3C polypeptide 6 [Anabrus simplex]|uniref:general transcription factor 3C polypeptide 6 n=1 Tax=Anabrus simplex TaxID=316456 RepID=UPI0035A3B2AE